MPRLEDESFGTEKHKNNNVKKFCHKVLRHLGCSKFVKQYYLCGSDLDFFDINLGDCMVDS